MEKNSGTKYDAEYYKCHCGMPYVRNDHWLSFFGRIADCIIEEIHPSTVLDAGCAKGFLVEALRDRGVEAYGIDISEYAVSQVREDIRPFCSVGSLAETLDRDYDLIITIEVLEHLSPRDGILAIRNLCQHSERILFSSTPDDKEEPTHICVQTPDYWARLFAENGYWHKLEFNASFISPQAMYFVKADKSIEAVVAYYEQMLYKRALEEKHSNLSQGMITAQLPISEIHSIVQVYWSPSSTLIESNSSCTDVIQEGKLCTYHLPIGQFPSKLLRIDPLNHPGFVEIKAIRIYGNDVTDLNSINLSNLLWSAEGDFSTVRIGQQIMTLKNEVEYDLRFLCLGDDPQLYLEGLAQHLVPEYHQVIMELEMRIISTPLKSLLEKLGEELNFKQEINGSIESKLNKALKASEEIHYALEQVVGERNKIALELVNLKLRAETQEQEIIRLGTEIIRKENQLAAKKISIMEIGEENFKHKKNIAIINSSLTGLRNENEQIKMRCAQQDAMFNSFLNSRSWRLTRPLRTIGRVIRPLLRTIRDIFDVIIRHRFAFRLDPGHQIERLPSGSKYHFESTGNDPQFYLQGKYPHKWIMISWEGAVERPMRPLLYIDRGQGFSTDDTVNLGLMMGQEPQKYRILAHLGKPVSLLRLDPSELPGQFIMENFSMRRLSRAEVFIQAVFKHAKSQGISIKHLPNYTKKAIGIIHRDGIRGLWRKAKNQIVPGNGFDNSLEYEQWLQYHIISDPEIERMKRHSEELVYKPLFSIIVPVYNVEEQWLRKCLDSVIEQAYPYWELCIADDASTNPHVRKVLEEYMAYDKRIKVVFREKNGHISEASNSALELATGEFVALLDNDDEMTVDALYENALLINKHMQADMIYSDEDKISEAGKRHSPFFKPDWSPDTFLSQMYTCHLGVYRRTLIEEIGGFRVGFEGSQDYDLVLRLTERTKEIYHIPKVLYHWRTITGSTAANADSKSYAFSAGERAIREALERRGENGWVESVKNYPGLYRVYYPLSGTPLISIIIPTRDFVSVLKVCLNSIFEKSKYRNFEVIIVDNGSKDLETHNLFEYWQNAEPERFRVLRLDIPFNFSKLNNDAAKIANGELLLLLNNDIEVISPDWLEEMAGQALRPSIGAVGAMLYYPDDTIQHAGVVLGIGGVAGHSHKGLQRYNTGYFDRLLLPANYSAVTGACLMIQKTKFWLVGGLEEGLSVAFNDVDFCLKLVDKGFYNILLPQVQLYHHESKSRGYEDTPEKQERFAKEIQFMQARWRDILNKDPFYNPNLTLQREDFSLGISDK